jgi:hypothetical protein
MGRVILDTDVSSLSLKRRLSSPVLTRLIGKEPCITFVTLGELTQWAELRQWGRRNRGAQGVLTRHFRPTQVTVIDPSSPWLMAR